MAMRMKLLHISLRSILFFDYAKKVILGFDVYYLKKDLEKDILTENLDGSGSAKEVENSAGVESSLKALAVSLPKFISIVPSDKTCFFLSPSNCGSTEMLVHIKEFIFLILGIISWLKKIIV